MSAPPGIRLGDSREAVFKACGADPDQSPRSDLLLVEYREPGGPGLQATANEPYGSILRVTNCPVTYTVDVHFQGDKVVELWLHRW